MENHCAGFRFYPTEEELITFYLRNKLDGTRPDLHRVIPVVNVFDTEPFNLPKLAGELCRDDMEQWFFFTPRQEREVRGGRPSRTTASGYWKATGSPSNVYSSDNRPIAVKKTMVFYKGKAPSGRKTKWKMNEYRAIDSLTSYPSIDNTLKLRHEFCLCRAYVGSGSTRAFDRRPIVEPPALPRPEPQEGNLPVGDRVTASFSHPPNSLIADRVSSPGSSYSEGDQTCDVQPESTSDGTNWEMVEGLEKPLWEWERLNWP